MKLNDDQVMREIVLSYVNREDMSISDGLAKKAEMLASGQTTPEQLNRCAKILIEYYNNTGTVPPYSRQEISNESYR